MKKEVVEKVIDEMENKLFGKGVVVQLTGAFVSDYERGRIAGQIEMLTRFKMELDLKDELQK